jgi:hypothetical protein
MDAKTHPRIEHQLGGPVLTVTSGPRGYRLAMVGGAHFEVLADGLNWRDAHDLYAAAKAQSARPFGGEA